MVQHADIDHTGLPGVGGGTPTRYGFHIYRNAATQNINNTSAALTFDTEISDVPGFHSGSASVATVPSGGAGVYILSGTTFASGAGLSNCGFLKNGNPVIGGGKDVSNTGAACYASASTTLILADADTIEFSVTTTANINLGHATVADAMSSFSAWRIGL